ncbi:sensor histidine kinase [Clostridium sardiniense]|uniref:sensor histidine kinase n=1 Tax=Clostridium sardiniense TaxID=29369 RepID=UPI003D33AA04
MIKEKYKNLPIFWKITVGSIIIFMIFLIFITIAQATVFFEWFFDHKNKYGIDLKIFEDIFESYGYLIIITTILGLIISIIGGLIISRVLLSNIRELTNTMKEIKDEGRLDRRVKVSNSNDEISKLGIVFNSLMDDVENSFNRERRFVQDASHELRTPLTIIKGHLSLLNRWGKDDKEVLDKSIRASSEEVDRLIVLVNALLDISKLDKVDEMIEGNCSIREVTDSVLNDFSVVHKDYNITCNYNGLTLFPMKDLHIKQLLIILIDNAIKYSKDRKDIKIEFENKCGYSILTVEDSGIGIPEKDIPLLFDRFYRVDESRNSKTGGNGLGLSIAQRIVTIYGGTISVESRPSVGSKFTIKIPENR